MTFGLENVTVRFGRRIALDNVSVPVEPARVSVIVGGDGAGKSTCLAALVGLVVPSSGRVRRPAKSQIGYVPATAGLYGDLTVEENLQFTAHAFRLGAAERDARMDQLLDQTGLGGARRRLGSHLSGGMQRKLAVAMALLHAPELLVLDEPTTGVDPVSRVDLWRLISRAAAEGVAVAATTTYVNEAARAASVLLLSSGRALVSGSPEAILDSIPGTLGTTTHGPKPTDRAWRRGATWRIWAPEGPLPDGVEAVGADFEDAVVVAELAAAAEVTV
jgi:ABC-2 type transport system ATP-binding protein